MRAIQRVSELLICVVVCFGLVAGVVPGSARKAEASSPHIVNSDFSYGIGSLYTCRACGWHYFDLNTLTYAGGKYDCPVHGPQYNNWVALPSSFNAAKFGWKSSQTYDPTKRWDNGQPSCVANCVEIQQDANLNFYAEITAAQKGTAIYQDISTEPGAVYKWSLRHASRSNEGIDSMSVMIGSPSSQTAQNATRTSVNGLGNKLGSVGTVISTPSSNSYAYAAKDQVPFWESYTGTYIVPAGQTTTRFTFKAITSMREYAGNLIDDITFTRSFALNYDLTGGSSSEIYSNASANNYAGYRIEDSYVTLTTSKPARSGYTFLGWSRTRIADATSKASYDSARSNLISGFTMPSAATTVYAVWAKNPTVVFKDGNGTVLKSQTVTIGSSASAPSSPSRTGYTFTGWNGSFNNVYSDSTVEAQWKPNTYRVSFKPNDASGSMGDQSFTYNVSQLLSPNVFERAGYLFSGWNTDRNGNGISFTNMQSVMNLASSDGANVALYAQWTPIRYFVAFEANGGSGAMYEQSLLFGEEQALRENGFRRTGFDWQNWDTNRYLSERQFSNAEMIRNLTETANDIVVLYAIWTAHRCLITFEANGGEGEMEAQSIAYDLPENLHANTFTRDDHTWTSWNTAPDGSGESFADEQSVQNLIEKDNATLTLYAQWEPEEQSSVDNPSSGDEGQDPEPNETGNSEGESSSSSGSEGDVLDASQAGTESSEGGEGDSKESSDFISSTFSTGENPSNGSADEFAITDEVKREGATTLAGSDNEDGLVGKKGQLDKTGSGVLFALGFAGVLMVGGVVLIVSARRQRKRELERKRKYFRSLLKL